jgi:hypothetical protein
MPRPAADFQYWRNEERPCSALGTLGIRGFDWTLLPAATDINSE